MCNYTPLFITHFRKSSSVSDVCIKGEPVETVKPYKYLGTIIDDKLTGTENVQSVYSKAMKKKSLLKVLHNLQINKVIRSLFHKSVVQSVLCFCTISKYGNSTKNDRKQLCKVVKIANKMGI